MEQHTFLFTLDDLLFIGQDNIVNDLFSAIQKQLMLRPTGELSMEQAISFLGRDNHKQRWPLRNQPKQRVHSNNVGRSRHDNMQRQQQLQGRQQTRQATTTMTTYPSTRKNMHCTDESSGSYNGWHIQDRTWALPTKELARSLQQPTYLDMKKMKHTLRYLQGTKDYKFILHPTTIPGDKDIPILDVYV